MKYLILLALILSLLLCGCAVPGRDDPDLGLPESNGDMQEVVFFRKVARETRDDGWVFTFVQEGYKEETLDDSDLIKYQFFGINLRYRYDDRYAITHYATTSEGVTISQTYVPGVLVWGNGGAAQQQDMELISHILDSSRTVDELLALDPDDYVFEETDKEMFFRLMRQALLGEPQKEGTRQAYWDKPGYAVMVEQQFLDGYQFQVSFLQETGCVDELYIDVLYQIGEEYADYVQLSDLVQNGTATEAQKAAFSLIQAICCRIKEEENYLAGSETYRDKTIGELDYSRLYEFLSNIHENHFTPYRQEPMILSEGILP